MDDDHEFRRGRRVALAACAIHGRNKKKWRRGTGPFQNFLELVGAGMDRNWQRWDAALATRFGLDRGPCAQYDMVQMNRAAQSVENHALGRFYDDIKCGS